MGFEVIDRRGGNKIVEAEPAVIVPAAVEERPRAKGTASTRGLDWKSVGYTMVFLMINKEQMLSGRAAGLRTDERLFTADWLLPPIWDEKLNWQWEAKKRLDTFRKCSCESRVPCDFHLRCIPGQTTPGRWLTEDMQRLQMVQAKPLPECLEILMKAEMARNQARVAIPRG